MELDKLIGQEITLIGTAKDAKGGAVLITSEKEIIFIKGLDSWSPELLNKQIKAKGVLKKEKFIPDPIIDKNGSISTGAYGDQLVFENAEFFEVK